MNGKERKQTVSSFIQRFTLPLANVWGVLLLLGSLVGWGLFVCFDLVVWFVFFLGGKHYNIKNLYLKVKLISEQHSYIGICFKITLLGQKHACSVTCPSLTPRGVRLCNYSNPRAAFQQTTAKSPARCWGAVHSYRFPLHAHLHFMAMKIFSAIRHCGNGDSYSRRHLGTQVSLKPTVWN